MRSILLSLSLAACSEYELLRPLGKVPAPPSPTSPPTRTTEVVTTPSDECLVDTDPFTVGIDEGCRHDPRIGGFDPVVEWAWDHNPLDPGFDQVMVTPIVADLDGDGLSDVVFTAFAGDQYQSAGAVVAVSGADGSTLWSHTDVGGHRPYGAGGVAVGDLEGDGQLEIVVAATDGLLCLEADGRFRWSAAVSPAPFGYPALSDVDGDGVAEVVYGSTLVEANGRVRWAVDVRSSAPMAFAVDLDGDGLSEVVDGTRVVEHDGRVRFDLGVDGFAAVGDLDRDGTPELVVTYPSQVAVLDPQGRPRWSFPIDDWGGGAPTLADFDGDGLPEIGVASKLRYRVLEGDGSVAWSRDVQDVSSARTGSSVFDFEGDGAADVVYADEEVLYVWDGRTGADKLAWRDHSSGTLYEYPVIVDLDRDDSAEIVLAENDFSVPGRRGVTVLGDRAGSWSDARALWNQHAYYVTNVADDGSIPVPERNWLTLDHFRDNDPWPDAATELADLVPGDVLACCLDDGGTEVWVPLANQGRRSSDGQVELRDGSGALLDAAEVTVGVGEGLVVGPLFAPDGTEGAAVTVRSSAEQCDEGNDSRAVPPCR